MRHLLFVFLLILSVNVAAQSPAVSRLFADARDHAGAGRFRDALERYKTALFLAENEYAGKGFRSRIHYNVGVCYFHLDRLDEATNHFKRSILLDTGYTRAHYALGMAQSRKRAWKAATVSFRSALGSDPRNGEAWFDLAFASLALNDLESAASAFAQSIAFGSRDSALSHNNIGVILAMKGDLARAEARFENAIALSNGRLYEAKRNLEFSRTKRFAPPELTALQYVGREVGLVVG